MWNYTKDKTPITFETGNWDGKRSDQVLVEDTWGNVHIAVLYEGFMDGSEFKNWCDSRDWEIENVIRWMYIPD